METIIIIMWKPANQRRRDPGAMERACLPFGSLPLHSTLLHYYYCFIQFVFNLHNNATLRCRYKSEQFYFLFYFFTLANLSNISLLFDSFLIYAKNSRTTSFSSLSFFTLSLPSFIFFHSLTLFLSLILSFCFSFCSGFYVTIFLFRFCASVCCRSLDFIWWGERRKKSAPTHAHKILKRTR